MPKTLEHLFRIHDTDPEWIKANAYVNVLTRLDINGDTAAAIRVFESWFAKSSLPRDWPVRNWYARVMAREGRVSEVVGIYGKWLSDGSGGVLEWLYYGNFLLEAGADPAEASSAYSKSISLEPEFSGVYGSLGDSLIMEGKIAEAKEVLYRGLELDPDDTSVLKALERALAVAGDEDELKRIRARIDAYYLEHPEDAPSDDDE